MVGAEGLLGESGATRSSWNGRPGSVPEPHIGPSTSTPSLEVDEQECRPRSGAGKLASAHNTQGDWAAWASTGGGTAASASLGGPHHGVARGRR